MKITEFTDADKAHLLEIYGGDEACLADDLSQIEEAATRTAYTYTPYHELGSKRIGVEEAIGLLGRGTWLSGLVRSAFHVTAVRCADDGSVLFDSSRLFK